MEEILGDFQRFIVPAITHWNHPAFMAYFANSATAAGVLGETLTAALNVNAMLWRTSPAATELEELTLDWLRQMLGVPDGFFGIIGDTASSNTLYALAAAREMHPELRIREEGMSGRADLPRVVVYCSEEAHSSVDKAVMTLGFGLEALKKNPHRFGTEDGRESTCRGRRKRSACGTRAGRRRRNGGDDFDNGHRSGSSNRRDLWTPRDVAPRRRFVRRNRGDSARDAARARRMRPRRLHGGESPQVAVHSDGLLGTVHTASGFAEARVPARSRIPVVSEGDAVSNLMDYGIALGRRFRALKLWFVIRNFGVDGFDR